MEVEITYVKKDGHIIRAFENADMEYVKIAYPESEGYYYETQEEWIEE